MSQIHVEIFLIYNQKPVTPNRKNVIYNHKSLFPLHFLYVLC